MYKEFQNKAPKSFKPIPPGWLDIGGVFLSFMEERKMDGATLARESGVSESEVYNVLKNRRTHAGLKTLAKLAHPLGKTLADIFNRLTHEKEGNVTKFDKDPAFSVEFKKQGVTLFSDIAPCPEFFIGRMTLLAGSKGFSSAGLKENCLIFLRVVRGSLEVEYGGKIYGLSTYQKLVLNGRGPHAVKNKSASEPAEALMVTSPSFLAS